MKVMYSAKKQIEEKLQTKEIFSSFYGNLGEIKKLKDTEIKTGAYEGACFFIETDSGRKYILKFSKKFKNCKEIEYIQNVINRVRERGFAEIPSIIPTDKRKIGVVEKNGRSFILYEFREGKIMNRFDYKKMGRFLAFFHNAVSGFKQKDPRAERKKIINLKKQTGLLKDALRSGNISSEDYNCILGNIRCFQNNFLRTSCGLKEWVIHSDFHNRNVLQKNNKFTGLLDLDDLHRDIRILDLSRVILCIPAIEDLIDFVKNYQNSASVKLSKNEILTLPEIWRYGLIKMLIWAVSSPEEKTVRKVNKKEKKIFKKTVQRDYNLWFKTLKKFDKFNWNKFYKNLEKR